MTWLSVSGWWRNNNQKTRSEQEGQGGIRCSPKRTDPVIRDSGDNIRNCCPICCRGALSEQCNHCRNDFVPDVHAQPAKWQNPPRARKNSACRPVRRSNKSCVCEIHICDVFHLPVSSCRSIVLTGFGADIAPDRSDQLFDTPQECQQANHPATAQAARLEALSCTTLSKACFQTLKTQ